MASYIISIEKTSYADTAAAEAAITGAGATVQKAYSQLLAYTFLVDATEEQLSSITGLTESSAANTVLVASHADAEFNTVHLGSASPGHQWNPQFDGTGTTVYLIDTGVSTNHIEFANATVQHLYKASNIADFADSDGHGTAIASLIVGGNVGMSPNVTLKSVKLFQDSNGTITVQEIVDGLDAILTDHSTSSSVVKVVCMPWKVTKNSLIDAKLAQLQDAGLILVAAAGNDSDEVDNYSPGGLDSIITVGAYDHETNQVASFNNLPRIDYVDDTATPIIAERVNNAQIDLFAVGTNVPVADVLDSNNYNYLTGTSVSAGITAGAVAQYIQQHGTETAATIQSYVTTAAYTHANGLSYDLVSTPVDGKIPDYANINYGRLEIVSIGTSSLATQPSGTLFNVQHGQSDSINLGLTAGASNVSVLDFSPLAPWMSFDPATGLVSADTSDTSTAPASIAPGIYNFAIKGDVNGETIVEEYSIGVYTTNEDELLESVEYYYDSDTDSYDEVIQYEASTTQKN